jgi:hypothetical protein
MLDLNVAFEIAKDQIFGLVIYQYEHDDSDHDDHDDHDDTLEQYDSQPDAVIIDTPDYSAPDYSAPDYSAPDYSAPDYSAPDLFGVYTQLMPDFTTWDQYISEANGEDTPTHPSSRYELRQH